MGGRGARSGRRLAEERASIKDYMAKVLEKHKIGSIKTHGDFSGPDFGVRETDSEYNIYIMDRGAVYNDVEADLKKKYPDIQKGAKDSFSTNWVIPKIKR